MEEAIALGLYLNGKTLEHIAMVINETRWITTKIILNYTNLRTRKESAALMTENSGWIKKGERAWNKGIPWSSDIKKKMSLAQIKSYKDKPELRELISIQTKKAMTKIPKHVISYWTGKKLSDTHKKNIGKNECLENHWNWQGGISFEPYGSEFNPKTKEEIKRRDGTTCKFHDCSAKDDLTIHHIDYDKRNNSKTNLITLCRRHNSVVNTRRDYWTNVFGSMMEGLLCVA